MYFQSLILALTYLLFFLAALGLRCCVQVFSICREQRLLSSCSTRAYCGGFSCSRAQALGHMVFSSCSTRAQQLQPVVSRAWGSIAVHTGPAAPQHVGSFWTWDWTCVPWVARWILKTSGWPGTLLCFLKNIYWFIWLHWFLVAAHRIFNIRCGMLDL